MLRRSASIRVHRNEHLRAPTVRGGPEEEKKGRKIFKYHLWQQTRVIFIDAAITQYLVYLSQITHHRRFLSGISFVGECILIPFGYATDCYSRFPK